MNIPLLFIFFIGEVIAVFVLSRLALQRAYPTFKSILKNDTLVVLFVSLLYLPGTIIHELSHYIVALLLHMHPSDIRIFPVIEKDRVRLGHVLYEKRRHDFLRSTIVGIAPFFGGLACVWIIIQTNQFPGETYWQTIVFGYLILTITANMFSSKQDLIDVGYLIPVGLFVGLLWYLISPFNISVPVLSHLHTPFIYFLTTLQTPLLFSVGIHAILVVLLSIRK